MTAQPHVMLNVTMNVMMNECNDECDDECEEECNDECDDECDECAECGDDEYDNDVRLISRAAAVELVGFDLQAAPIFSCNTARLNTHTQCELIANVIIK